MKRSAREQFPPIRFQKDVVWNTRGIIGEVENLTARGRVDAQCQRERVSNPRVESVSGIIGRETDVI